MSSRQERARGSERTDAPRNESVLLLAPSIGRAEREACTDLLTGHDLGASRVAHVLYMETATERCRLFEERVGRQPEQTTVVAVGAGGVATERESQPPRSDYAVETVSDPADLTGLGMALGRWLQVARHGDRELALCFDSLSILLQYAAVDRVFRFLHSFTGRLNEAGATAHFHLDPAAHDERTVARLSQVFDSVVNVSDHENRVFGQ